MIPSQIIEVSLQQTNVKLADIGDGVEATGTARLYQYLNMVKDFLWNKIVGSSTGRDFSWEEWNNDLAANVSEYALPQVVSDENRLKKIESLWITYSGATYSRTGKTIYTPARLVDRASLEKDWAYYEENQSQSDPIYYVSDKSLFIAPTIASWVTNGLQLTGVKKIPDYTASTTEEGMVIPDDMHYLLVTGLTEQIYLKKGSRVNAQTVKAEYRNDVRETLNVERDSHVWPTTMHFPDTLPTTRNVGNSYITLP